MKKIKNNKKTDPKIIFGYYWINYYYYYDHNIHHQTYLIEFIIVQEFNGLTGLGTGPIF